MKTLNFPLEDVHYEALNAKREALSQVVGKHVSWKKFLFLLEDIPDRILIKTAKRLNYQTEDDSGGD